MERYKKAEHIALPAIFLITVSILVLTFINNRFDPFDTNWVWDKIVLNILPSGFDPLIFVKDVIRLRDPYPGIPFFAVLGITLFILLPMSLRKRTSFFGAVGMMVSSYLFAGFLWLYALAWVSSNLGVTIIGLCFGYVGIIPIAVIEMLMPLFSHGFLEPIIIVAVLIACIVAARKIKNHGLSVYMSSKNKEGADTETANKSGFWKKPQGM